MSLLDWSLDNLALPLILATIAVAAWWAWQVKRDSPHWPNVQGEILVSRARAMNETGDQGGQLAHHWLAEVEYRYEVNGQTYTGRGIRALGLNHFDEASALSELAPFPVGARVPVYYRPDQPGTAVLIPG